MNSNKNTFWYVFCSGCILLKEPASPDKTYSIPQSDEPPVALKEWTTVMNLPDDKEGNKRKAYSINTPAYLEGYKFTGLRESFNCLNTEEYVMASKAAELLYWDSNTKYCGICGAPMRRVTDISKQCTHCGKEIWPQVSPAIIVRIRRVTDGEEKILLVHAKNFRRTDMYGLVAGFVETGETLEECVRREVAEETHLKVKNIQYFGSQQWPYPSGIMIGFTADYDEGEIEIQEEELSRAGWFGRTNMPPIPDKMSIARKLIDDWLDK